MENKHDVGNIGNSLTPNPCDNAALLRLRDADLAGRIDHDGTALQDAAALAECALAESQQSFMEGLYLPEVVYLWSRRVLRNRLALAPDQVVQALAKHAEAMRHLEQVASRSIPFTPKICAELPRLEAAFFRLEAECLVEQERRPKMDRTICMRRALSTAISIYSIRSMEYSRSLRSWSTQSSSDDWLATGPELPCRWSARWMRSEAETDVERRAVSFREHLARLEELKLLTKKAYQSGRAPLLYLLAIESRLCEARFLSSNDASEWKASAEHAGKVGAERLRHGFGTIEDAYIFSLQILKAAIATHSERKADALRAHAASMSALRGQTLELISARIVGPYQGFSAAYYASEAAAWLDHPPDINELE